MYLEQASTLVDQLIYEFNGERLNDLERSIVQGVCEGKKYGEIAEELDCTTGHVTDTAAQIWQSLSKAIGEKVTKTNFKSAIERYQSSIVSSHRWKVGSINFCANDQDGSHQHPEIQRNTRTPQSQKYLLDAPALIPFYGRTTELTQLQQWIENQSRTILIHGASGSGKTALARQLLDQIHPQFDTILWQSLSCQRSLSEFLDRNIIPNFPRILQPPLDLASRITDLITQLSNQRCLIILDDLQEILESNQLAGSYSLGYQEYRQLIQRLATAPHQSCILLLSWEKTREIEQLTAEHSTVQSLELTGLGTDAQPIFHSHALTDPEQWPSIIDYYGGNPRALQIIVALIQKFFGGSAATFAQTQPLPVPADYKQVLQSQLDRLSPAEKLVLQQIAADNTTILQLQKSSTLSPAEIIDGLQSLDRRNLLQKDRDSSSSATMVFRLQPALKNFLNSMDTCFKRNKND